MLIIKALNNQGIYKGKMVTGVTHVSGSSIINKNKVIIKKDILDSMNNIYLVIEDATHHKTLHQGCLIIYRFDKYY